MKKPDPTKFPAQMRLDRGLLKQFDATAKAKGLNRTEAMEAAMRVWMNGPANVPKPLGYDPVSGEPIWKREAK